MKTAYDLMMNGKNTEFEKYIDENPGLVKACDGEGFTLLHQAATNDCHEALQYLIHKGAAIDAKGPAGEQALHLAAYNGSLPCIRTLDFVPDDLSFIFLHYEASMEAAMELDFDSSIERIEEGMLLSEALSKKVTLLTK